MVVRQGEEVGNAVGEIRWLAEDSGIVWNAAHREDAGGTVIGNVATQGNDVTALIHFKILSMAIRDNGVLQENLCIKDVGPDRSAVTGGIEIFMEGATVHEHVEFDSRIDGLCIHSAAAEAAGS